MSDPNAAGSISFTRQYTYFEYFKRFIWSLIWPFFRLSPRLLYGWRNMILRLLGARIGKGVKIFPSADIIFPWNLEIGNNTVISWDVKLYSVGKITIGRDTVISQYTHICAGSHDYKDPGFVVLKPPITIGNHVWIATEAFIGPDVVIGDRCVVAARAVVIKDVEANTIVAGHPAIVIKQI